MPKRKLSDIVFQRISPPDTNTTLTPDEQKIYDEAYAMSMEKPCCCKCWHYYTNEGIAKKMIKDGVFNAQQIAAYWDTSDICGS